ncbi:unknown [Clostridium sp. CAG:343]|jgi:MoaA/NifB/PqqE/SkfB family radical SAM enzyme|nr:radical SAM protein [Clostridia bacterium]CDC06474.1 unknown [Clostridium sp. CAG:343]
MDKLQLLKKVKSLTLYTGTYGRRKCTCSCIGCTQESYGRKHKEYQGNLEQIQKIIEKLPNLEEAYILGNPDVSVDTEFCNLAAKEFIKHGKKVMFSTSGYNGVKVIKKLIQEIDPNNIQYISYSIDSLDNEKLQFLKGTNKIDIKEIDKAIYYCKENRNSCKNSTNIMGNKPRRL